MEGTSFVKIHTYGICTHIEPATGALKHRVVLVNAMYPNRLEELHPQLRNKGLDAHVATLQIARADLPAEIPERPWFHFVTNNEQFVEWELFGVNLRIGNAMPMLTGPRTGTCIPHLTDYCDELRHIGALTIESNPENTACFLDLPAPGFVGKSIDGGAAVAELTVAVWDSPSIEVTPFSRGDGEALSFPIRPEAEITISNIPAQPSEDKNADFLLHFLTASEFPQGASFPDAPCRCMERLSTYNPPHRLADLTVPGCSNSNYP